jgi:hypothetical protein
MLSDLARIALLLSYAGFDDDAKALEDCAALLERLARAPVRIGGSGTTRYWALEETTGDWVDALAALSRAVGRV